MTAHINHCDKVLPTDLRQSAWSARSTFRENGWDGRWNHHAYGDGGPGSVFNMVLPSIFSKQQDHPGHLKKESESKWVYAPAKSSPRRDREVDCDAKPPLVWFTLKNPPPPPLNPSEVKVVTARKPRVPVQPRSPDSHDQKATSNSSSGTAECRSPVTGRKKKRIFLGDPQQEEQEKKNSQGHHHHHHHGRSRNSGGEHETSASSSRGSRNKGAGGGLNLATTFPPDSKKKQLTTIIFPTPISGE